jgi:hypothetical protein
MILRNAALAERTLGGPAWLVVLVLVGGCARGPGSVSGTVTYQGKPLETGTITFYDTAHNAPTAEINKDGTYSIPKVAAGKAKIAVVMPMPIAFKSGDLPGAGKPAEPLKVPTLPAKYADPEKSGLTFEVNTGSNTHDVKLD